MGENNYRKINSSDNAVLQPIVVLENLSEQLISKKLCKSVLFRSESYESEENKTPIKNSTKNETTPKKTKSCNRTENSNSDSELGANADADVQTPQSVRRSTRKKKLTLKALESLSLKTPDKTHRKKKKSVSEDNSDGFSDIEDCNFRPSTLFEEHVTGKNMFGFQTPKRKNAMLKKASEVTDSPRLVGNVTPSWRTPRSSRRGTPVLTNLTQTPHTVRKQIKKKLMFASKVEESCSDSNLSDFSGSESDFVPSNDSSDENHSSDENDSSVIDEQSESEGSNETNTLCDIKTENNTLKTRSTRKTKEDLAYVLKSDDYFASHSSKKTVTSNHTLDKLKNPRMQQDQLQKLLASMKISKKHEEAIDELLYDHKNLFTKWMFCLFEGFNVLTYGLGSKRRILELFQREMLSEYPVIVVNGFFPSLVIKDVLDSILHEIVGVAENISNVHESIDIIEQNLSQMSDVHLFLIVHNIDGEMLRNNKAQNVFSKLANITNVHLITSIDHINAPLIWDHTKLSRFNFTWWDVTTFLPYIDETSFEGSLLVQRSGALTLSSLKNIFLSLTTNARGIFNIVIKNQISRSKDSGYQGMSFKDLYGSCREAFLVSSDVALRSQLTEFLDHKIIKYRRNYDGVELMYIPIENSLLQHFINEQLNV